MERKWHRPWIVLIAFVAGIAGCRQSDHPGSAAAEPEPALAEGWRDADQLPDDLASGRPADSRYVNRVILGSGLMIEDIELGEGEEALPGAIVRVEYVGTLAATGGVFDRTEPGESSEMPLSKLIRGWQDGIPGMRVGGVRRLTIPPALAYGERTIKDDDGNIVIPPGSTLVFDVTLVATRSE